MLKKTLFLIVLLLLVSAQYSFTEDFKCGDHGELDTLLQLRPGDLEIQALHALHLGLCQKIQKGDITANQAKDIYSNVWKALLHNKIKINQ